jgi:hypothetical protein
MCTFPQQHCYSTRLHMLRMQSSMCSAVVRPHMSYKLHRSQDCNNQLSMLCKMYEKQPIPARLHKARTCFQQKG